MLWMKKRLKITTTVYIVLTIIGFIVIRYKWQTYNVKLPILNQNYSLFLDNYDGEVEIINERQDKDNYIVTVKSVKPWKVNIWLKYDDFSSEHILYVHKTMVITYDNFFGDSTRCEIIPITLAIFMAYCLYVLISSYKKNLESNLYQYKNVSYLWFIIFISSSLISTIISIFNYHWIYDTISKIIKSIIVLSYILLPFAFILFILVLIPIIKLISKEGKSLRNLLWLLFAIFLCLVPFIPRWTYVLLKDSQIINLYDLNWAWPYLFSFVESFIYLGVSYLECVLIWTIIIALKAANRKIAYNKDYMLILWCKIKEDWSLTPLLKWRVDKAIDFRNDQLTSTGKDLVFVPSWWKGSDENLSEWEAIRRYLIKNWIAEENILLENQSINTYENIKLSNKLINDNKANVAFSTTNYHVFRAWLLANEQWLYWEGIWAKTKTYFRVNAFIREFIGTLYTERKSHGIFILNITITLIIMIWMTYLANNI